MRNRLFVKQTLNVGLLLLASQFFLGSMNGCGPTEPQLQPPPPAGLTDYYMPRNTAIRYWYKHYDWTGPSSHDSVYVLTYQDYLQATTFDGLGPIDEYAILDSLLQNSERLQTFVSDSQVIEYGAWASSSNNRFVRLNDSLIVGKTWVAADSYRTPEGIDVKIMAHVDQWFDALVIDSVSYPSVYQVSYRVSVQSPVQQGEFQDGARRVAFYAHGYGKILETCYDPNNTLLWRDELHGVTARH